MRSLMRQLAHAQRVGGSGEKDVLLAVARLGKSGSEFEATALRALTRIIGLEASMGLHARRSTPSLDRDRMETVSALMAELGLPAFGELVLETFVGCHRESMQAAVPELDQKADEQSLERLQHLADSLASKKGKDHPEYTETLGKVARALEIADRLDESLSTHVIRIQILARVRGGIHPEIMSASEDLADCIKNVWQGPEGHDSQTKEAICVETRRENAAASLQAVITSLEAGCLLYVLRAFTKQDVLRDVFVAAGGVDYLAELLEPSRGVEAREAADLLFHLASGSSEHKDAIAKGKALHGLVKLVRLGTGYQGSSAATALSPLHSTHEDAVWAAHAQFSRM